jgi:hypothetical protein
VDLLSRVARGLGLKVSDDLTAEIESVVREKVDDRLIPYYWNTGEKRPALEEMNLVEAHIKTKPPAIPQPLTQYGKYKHDIINVGIEHYKVI